MRVFTNMGKLLIALFLLCQSSAFIAVAQAPAAQGAVKQFQSKLQNYISIQKKASASVPSIPKNTTDAAMIADHQQKLATAIRSLRPHAMPGDIFTPEVRSMILSTIKAKLDTDSRKTILGEGNPKSGESPTPVNLAVNATYPSSAPVSTVPASILMALPTLPPEVEFRFVGHTLILRDTKANVIVDLIRNAV